MNLHPNKGRHFFVKSLEGRSSGLIVVTLVLIMLYDSNAAFPQQNRKNSFEEKIENRQKTEIMNFFLNDPSVASIPQTPIAIELYNQAVDAYKRREYDLAKQLLKDSIQYDTRNALAYELLGDIEYLKQKQNEAKDYFKKAYLIKPSDDLKEKIEKINREIPLEKKFSTLEYDHFILRHQGDSELTDLSTIKSILKESYEKISADFGYSLKTPATVSLYDQDEFEKVTKMPFWITGLYDGTVRLPAYRSGFSDLDLKAISVHEMTHAFVSEIGKGKVPAWLTEGLAVYEENKIRPKDFIVFRSAIKTNTLLSLDRLMIEEKSASEHDPLWANLFYEESAQVVAYLVERYGMFKMRKLLDEFSKDKNSEEAMTAVYKKSIKQIEKKWKNYVTKK